MISISRWLTAPFARLRRMTFGTRWVEPWNEITVAVYSSLQPAPAAAEAPAYASADYASPDALTPAETPAAATGASPAEEPGDRKREAA